MEPDRVGVLNEVEHTPLTKKAPQKRQRLTETAVKNIRELYATGDYTQAKLAKIFNTTQANVSHIVRNRTHVK